MLALLLLKTNELVTVDELIDVLWGSSPPPTVENSLQVHVHRLRKLVGRERLQTVKGGYALELHSGELDLERFRAFAAEGRRSVAAGDRLTGADHLANALGLWRGRPLPELRENPALAGELARLDDEFVAVVEDRIDADLQLGRHRELVSELEVLVDAHPLRERLMSQLMLALYRSERQIEALEGYTAARRRLVDELGLEPGKALKELHQQILAHDPTLDAPPRASRPTAPPVRRHLTLLLVALALPTLLDPEVAARRLSRAREVARNVLEKYLAVVDEPLGDTVVATFGLPAAQEDDALRALGAAAELREALRPTRVGSRIAIHSAQALATDDRLLDDQMPGRLMELKDAADLNEIIIGDTTRRLVWGAVELRASAAPGAWQVVTFDPEADPIERQFGAPLVGRASEVARLREAFDWMRRTESCHLVTVLGSAGIGKSRLARELAALVDDEATVLTGRPAGDGGGVFAPLAQMVKHAAGETHPSAMQQLLAGSEDAQLVVDQLAAALGTGEGAKAEDAFWAFRRAFIAIARQRPLVLVFEDLHSAEARLLMFIEELVSRSEDSRILVVCLARPDLLEEHPSWGGGRLDAETIQLEPLSRETSDALVCFLEERLPTEARDSIVRRSDGNPLFIEQLVAFVSSGAPEDEIPPTIQAVLAARLDRLTLEERRFLERASVIGQEFAVGEVTVLLPTDETRDVIDVARTLIRKGLVRSVRGDTQAGESLRFQHPLIRDVAYDSVLKSTRAVLHEQYATVLSESSGGESAAAVALHLERSYDLRLELDPDADDLPKIATEVGERLVEAGQEALRRSDVRSAVRFLERGLELVSDESPAKGHAFAGLTYAYRLGARWDLVRSYLQKGFAFADAASDKALDAYLTVSELQLRLHTEPDFTLQEFIQVASACLSVLERARRSTYRSRLRVALAWPYALQGQSQRAENLITAALREDGSHRDAEKLLPSVWLTGALRVEDAIGRCERLLAERPTPRTAASCYRSLAILHAMAEQFDEARELAKKDRDILEELGAPMLAVGASSIQGEIELLSGKPDAAANILRRGWHQLSELGGAIYLPGIAALLSRALLEQGRDEDAWLALEGADAASAKDVAYVVHLEGVRARLLGRRMADVDAVAAARRAVAAAAGTDSPDLRADASVDLGAVLATLGHRNEARHALEKAVKLYDEKGNAARSHTTRAMLRSF